MCSTDSESSIRLTSVRDKRWCYARECVEGASFTDFPMGDDSVGAISYPTRVTIEMCCEVAKTVQL
jgi:hypothetical protein